MKLYVHDEGWRGAFVVIAPSREAAIRLITEKNKGPLMSYGTVLEPSELEEHEIPEAGICLETIGDR